MSRARTARSAAGGQRAENSEADVCSPSSNSSGNSIIGRLAKVRFNSDKRQAETHSVLRGSVKIWSTGIFEPCWEMKARQVVFTQRISASEISAPHKTSNILRQSAKETHHKRTFNDNEKRVCVRIKHCFSVFVEDVWMMDQTCMLDLKPSVPSVLYKPTEAF